MCSAEDAYDGPALMPSALLFLHLSSEVSAAGCRCLTTPQPSLFSSFSAEQRDIALFTGTIHAVLLDLHSKQTQQSKGRQKQGHTKLFWLLDGSTRGVAAEAGAGCQGSKVVSSRGGIKTWLRHSPSGDDG